MIFRPLFFMLISLIFTQSLMAATPESEIRDSMSQTINDITLLIKDEKIDKKIRNKKIDLLVTPLFDFNLMSRLSLGKTQWKKISSDEKKNFTEIFTKRIKLSYMDKLDLYTDEQIIIDKAVRVKSRIHLPTYMIQKGEKKEILYKFYHSKKQDKWLIYDVDLLGVSILQTYRSQFAGILKKDSFNTLIEKLKTNES